MSFRWRGLGPAIFWLNLAIGGCGTAMLSLAIVLEWVLPPGRGRGFVWLGLGRHDWGAVHLWLGVTLSLLVVVHLLHHWRWIRSRWSSLIGGLSSVRTWIVLALLALLLALPALIPAQRVDGAGRGPGHGVRREPAGADSAPTGAAGRARPRHSR